MRNPLNASESKRAKSSFLIHRTKLSQSRGSNPRQASCSFDQVEFDAQSSQPDVDLKKSIRNLNYWTNLRPIPIKNDVSFSGAKMSMVTPANSRQQSIELNDDQQEFKVQFHSIGYNRSNRPSKVSHNASLSSEGESLRVGDNNVPAALNRLSRVCARRPIRVLVTNDVAISETLNKEIISSMVTKKICSVLKAKRPKDNLMPLIQIEADKIISNFSSLSKSINIKILNSNSIAKRIETEMERRRFEKIQPDNPVSFFLKRQNISSHPKKENAIAYKLDQLRSIVLLIKEQKKMVEIEEERHWSFKSNADKLEITLKKLIDEEVS